MGGLNQSYYWMMVTLDDLELPLVVADTRRELSQITGVREKTITEHMSKAKMKGIRSRYIKVRRENVDDRNM